MFRKILVPVDFSDRNVVALDHAQRLVGSGDGEVIMLHVIETLDAPFDELEEFYRQLEDRARQRMNELAARLRGSVRLSNHIRYGSRVREIVEYARDQQVDLVVVSSHQLDPDRPAQTWMTISHQVAILADNPVLVLK